MTHQMPSALGDTEPDAARRGRATNARWHPGVPLIMVLVVLLPLLATGVLTGSRLKSGWAYRDRARRVAVDTDELQVLATARANVTALSVPLETVSYAAGVGVDEILLNTLMKPVVPFRQQLSQAQTRLGAVPLRSTTPEMRADLVDVAAIVSRLEAGTIEYIDVQAFTRKLALDFDNAWYAAYAKMQADISAWNPPGSFETHASALRQTYEAYLTVERLVNAAGLTLETAPTPESTKKLIESAREYDVAISQFTGLLGPGGQAVWESVLAKPSHQQFRATVQQALGVALDGDASPFANNAAYAGTAMAAGLDLMADFEQVVTSASRDLHVTALAEADKATRHFVSELIVVVVLALVSVAGVIVAARLLTRPLRRLAASAQQVHDGDFDLEPLPAKGPREVVTTMRAFNDMASTLKGVESRAVALAGEDFSHPQLLVPLPGRTGQALQATIDSLGAIIREREQQRQLLHEAATHDQSTGLFNRAAVIEYLTNDVTRRRLAGETVAVLFIDLDGLKQLNDAYGHEVGDSAVVSTAEAILDATNQCDVVGRLGGDEFLVVLCHNHSGEGPAIAERINESLAHRSLPVANILVPLRASVGAALARCDADTDPMTLVHQADAAMYQAKRAARAARDQLAPTAI